MDHVIEKSKTAMIKQGYLKPKLGCSKEEDPRCACPGLRPVDSAGRRLSCKLGSGSGWGTAEKDQWLPQPPCELCLHDSCEEEEEEEEEEQLQEQYTVECKCNKPNTSWSFRYLSFLCLVRRRT